VRATAAAQFATEGCQPINPQTKVDAVGLQTDTFDQQFTRTTAALSIGQKAPHAFKASKAVFPIDVV
jgi:hypothetical protein